MTPKEKLKILKKEIRKAHAERKLALYNHQYDLASAWRDRAAELEAEKELLENSD